MRRETETAFLESDVKRAAGCGGFFLWRARNITAMLVINMRITLRLSQRWFDDGWVLDVESTLIHCPEDTRLEPAVV